MKMVEIEGPLDDLRALHDIPDLDVQSGVRELGGGLCRRSALVRSDAAIETLEARGLTVRVTLDESDIARDVARHVESMRNAPREPAPSAARKKDEPK